MVRLYCPTIENENQLQNGTLVLVGAVRMRIIFTDGTFVLSLY
jgi:hypothetical protein